MQEVVGTNAVNQVEIQDDILYNKTTFYDDTALARNQRIKESGMLDKGKLPLHENEDIRGVISCPSTLQWSLFNKKHPELKPLLNSPHEYDRIQGLKLVSLHKPGWVLMTRT